jgi:iron complex transport system ATP-binding protein
MGKPYRPGSIPGREEVSMALQMVGVSVRRRPTSILRDVNWSVNSDQRWAILGPNGSGKSTLLKVAGLQMHPTTGRVEVLGQELGRTDIRKMRHRIGYSAAALADQLRPGLTATEVVMTAKHGALEPWWHEYSEADRERAVDLLARFGCSHLTERAFGLHSSGERQRVLLARTLMTDPGLVLLDEPTAGLDLGGREDLVADLATLAADAAAPPTVLVTHHVEEIPRGFTHVALVSDGQVTESGPLEETLTAAALSECFGRRLQLERRLGRWWAWLDDDQGPRTN